MSINQHFYLTVLLLIILLTILAFKQIAPADKPTDKPVYKPPDKVMAYKPIEQPSRGGRILQMEATAYCLEDGNGDGVTATGTIPQEGRTVAVDPNVIPYGTELSINGKDGYIAEDTGGGIKGNRIDVYVGSGHEAYRKAVEFGRQEVEVQAIE